MDIQKQKIEELSFSSDNAPPIKELNSDGKIIDEEKSNTTNSKLQYSYIADEIIKKAKQVLGSDTIFILLDDPVYWIFANFIENC